MSKKNWIFIFLPILLLTISSSLVSLLTANFYVRDSEIMAVKSHYLDLINIGIVVPFGILMFVLALKNLYWAKLFILGIMVYLAFMFGLNATSLFFNDLFLIYVTLFSLNIFGIILGYGDLRQGGSDLKLPTAIKISGGFLLLYAISGYASWLMEVIGATQHGTIPESIVGMNLPVSVVHVFDLAMVLPMMVIGAVLIFKGKRSGLIISSIMTVFLLFTCLSVLVMELALQNQNMPVDEGKLYAMYVLAPLSIFPLVILFRAVSKIAPKKMEDVYKSSMG